MNSPSMRSFQLLLRGHVLIRDKSERETTTLSTNSSCFIRRSSKLTFVSQNCNPRCRISPHRDCKQAPNMSELYFMFERIIINQAWYVPIHQILLQVLQIPSSSWMILVLIVRVESSKVSPRPSYSDV